MTFAVDIDQPQTLPATGDEIGIDLGLKDFAVTSEGGRIANPRRDFLHKTSTALIERAGMIVLENLAVANMVRNRSLAKTISDASWAEFRSLLEYKAVRAGRHLIVIDRWYPSSKTCSACGHLLPTLDLGTRCWTCPACRSRHDRDINAAKNILAAGRAVAGTPGDACGADVVRREAHVVRVGVKDRHRRPVAAGRLKLGAA